MPRNAKTKGDTRGPNPQVIFHYSHNINKILYYERIFFSSIHTHTHELVAATDVVAFKTSKSSADPLTETVEGIHTE